MLNSANIFFRRRFSSSMAFIEDTIKASIPPYLACPGRRSLPLRAAEGGERAGVASGHPGKSQDRPRSVARARSSEEGV